jgi:hypothetical protein
MVGLKINTFDPKPACGVAAAEFADADVVVAQATAMRVPATKIARNMRMLISLLFNVSSAVTSENPPSWRAGLLHRSTT